MRSETKIFNLETHEFVSNPPFFYVPPFPFRNPKTAVTEVKKKQLAGNVSLLLAGTGALKKLNLKTWNLKKTKFRKMRTDHTSLAHPPSMLRPTTMMSPLPHFH